MRGEGGPIGPPFCFRAYISVETLEAPLFRHAGMLEPVT